ncbi:MAG: PLDc N-terminal domain-containing protein, partial [Streptococcus sp.]|nr:PLDc N-terminal domain-containing protein [Streptococcus sp.]
MAFISSILYIIILVNTFAAIITVFREPREIAATWGWLIVLVMLPVFGFIIYFFFGRRIRKKRIFNLRAQETVGLQKLVEQQQRDLAYTKEKVGPAKF